MPTTYQPEQSPSVGQGLTNLRANVNVPIFSGFAVEANVAMRQRLEEAAHSTVAEVRRATALACSEAGAKNRVKSGLLKMARWLAATDRRPSAILHDPKGDTL